MLACEEAGITAVCPKPLTSGAKAGGRFGKQDFVYQPGDRHLPLPGRRDAHPALLQPRTRADAATAMRRLPVARAAPVRANCTASIERRIKRWEHEEVIDDHAGPRSTAGPMPCGSGDQARSSTSSAPSRTGWAEATSKHEGSRNLATEASLHILAYNIKRAIALVGGPGLIAAMQS